jgi:hypothetical protein
VEGSAKYEVRVQVAVLARAKTKLLLPPETFSKSTPRGVSGLNDGRGST